MASFLDSAADLLDRSEGSVSAHAFRYVFRLLEERLPILFSKSVVDLTNIESLFSIIEMGRFLGRLPMTPPEEIDHAHSAVRTLIAETIEETCLFRTSPEGRWLPHEHYSRLVAAFRGAPASDVVFLTFNYDVAIDFALHSAGSAVDYALGDAPLDGAVPLLKLHGSLNWARCTECDAISVLPFDRYFKGGPGSHPLKAARLPMRLREILHRVGRLCPHDSSAVVAAIVPPTWNKTEHHKIFHAVWKRAASEMATADRIVIAGYSFPASDGFFRDLLALGLLGTTRLRQFAVVDPDPEVHGRFRALLSPQSQRRYVGYQARFEDALPNLAKEMGWVAT